MLTRRLFLSATSATSTLSLLPGTWKAAWASPNPPLLERDGDRVLGKTEAPITIVEYASFTCLHCADFALNLLPRIQEEWIDLGKAKLIYRDFPLDQMAYEVSLLARAIPEGRYFAFIHTLFARQEKWMKAKDPRLTVSQLAKLAGLGEADISAAFANRAMGDAILAQAMEASEKLQVQSTPTVFVNGKRANHSTYERFSAELHAAL